MNIRKANLGELKKIIKCANKAFSTERPSGYTFIKSVSKIYDNKNKDYSDIHFVAENENKDFVSLAGNLFNTIKINNKSFIFSSVGTVSTIPEYRNKGLMQQIFQVIDAENIKKNAVFSILVGSRPRYKNFGYDKIGFEVKYCFNKNYHKYFKNTHNINIESYKKHDLNELFDIYKQNNTFILRDKNNFEICLNNPKSNLFTIKNENKIIGYCSISENTIIELQLSNLKYLESVIALFLVSNELIKVSTDNKNHKLIYIYANILNKKVCNELNRLSEYKQIKDNNSVKVYDIPKFIEMLYLLNKKKINNVEEIYKINETVLCFSVKDNALSIKKSKKQPLKVFNSTNDFIYFATHINFENDLNSKIFPLFFDINIADRF